MPKLDMLPGVSKRSQHMRVDAAQVLKRLFFAERASTVAQAGWLAGIPSIDAKIALSRILWEDAKTAEELRNRVFELRFPSRELDPGADAMFVEVFEHSIHAPSAAAFLLAQARVLKPALLAAYAGYVTGADGIADGPSIRFMRAAIADKETQIEDLGRLAELLLDDATDSQRQQARAFVDSLGGRLEELGGTGLDTPATRPGPIAIDHATPFELAESPARDPRFHLCRFPWPDVVDETFPYGEGLMLQLRSAVSHLNEVWAVETGGMILYSFADQLPWEFVLDAARWTYDEGRHTQMGRSRLQEWGYEPSEVPLGTYIIDSAKGQHPIYRMGMLHHFETKNIGKKNERAAAFASFRDDISRHDMEFDWADETMHAHYGEKWLATLRETRPDEVPDRQEINARCAELVEAVIDTATSAEIAEVTAVANAMIAKARGAA